MPSEVANFIATIESVENVAVDNRSQVVRDADNERAERVFVSKIGKGHAFAIDGFAVKDIFEQVGVTARGKGIAVKEHSGQKQLLLNDKVVYIGCERNCTANTVFHVSIERVYVCIYKHNLISVNNGVIVGAEFFAAL